MIKFAKERVNLICNQLKGWSIVQKVHLDSMRVKEGCFITPTEADAETGRIAIYYGCADSVTGLAFTTVDELISYMKENSL